MLLGPLVARQLRSGAKAAQHQLLLAAYGTKARKKSCKASQGAQGGEPSGCEERRQSGANASSSGSSSSSSDSSSSSRHSPDLKRLADMTQPSQWFPSARAMKRTIIAHLGPTNSGKTHAALSALKAARSGVYCGPLRLLACEVADRLNAEGVACHLVTGQEVRSVKGAHHTACTVEMAQLDHTVEVAVLDEVQMLADPGRGSSWSHALLGLPARELHVCGDACSLPLLQRMAAECGDELQVKRYRRLSPLVVMGEALGGVQKVQEGDCVVAFSRRALHRLRREVEATGKHTACMVYGALPPDVRRRQAALFNTDSNAYGVLVASDAIGQGLNLSIQRIVFLAMSKYDGTHMRPLTASEVKQIAGRAGRYGLSSGDGYVTTMSPGDLPHLQTAMATPSDELAAACLMPRFEQLALFTSAHVAAAGTAETAGAAARGATGMAAAAAGAGAAAGGSVGNVQQNHASSNSSSSGRAAGGRMDALVGRGSLAQRRTGAMHRLHTRAPLFDGGHAAAENGAAHKKEESSEEDGMERLASSSSVSGGGGSSSNGSRDSRSERAKLFSSSSDASCSYEAVEGWSAASGSSGRNSSSTADGSSAGGSTSSSETSRPGEQTHTRSSSRSSASGDSFAAALEAFCTQASLSPSYFLGDATNMALLAKRLGDVALPFEDLHTFCTSPTDTGSQVQMAALALFARRYAQAGGLGAHCVEEGVPHAQTALEQAPASDVELRQVEELWHVYSLYVWLGGRFGPGVFQGLAEAEARRSRCAELIELGLQRAAAAAAVAPKSRLLAAGGTEPAGVPGREGQARQGQQEWHTQQDQWQQQQRWDAKQQRELQWYVEQQPQEQKAKQNAQWQAARAEWRAARKAKGRRRGRWALEEEASGWAEVREAAHAW